MAGLTLASPSAERQQLLAVARDLAALSPPQARRGQRGAAARPGRWPWCSAPSLWRVPINDIDFTAQLEGPSLAHPFGTDDLGQDILARMIYGGRISLAVGLAAMMVSVIVGTLIGALAGMSRGALGHGADVAHRSVPVAAAIAAAAAADLPVPRRAQGRVRPRGRHLHPDRAGDRRAALDAGRPAGARAVPLAAREGVRRSRPRARRQPRCGRWSATSCPTRSDR